MRGVENVNNKLASKESNSFIFSLKECFIILWHLRVKGINVSSLYTNIPQEEGITIVCNAYENFHAQKPPIGTKFLREMLILILKENSFQFNGKNYLQTHGTAMGTKMAVAFANIFMASIEKEILRRSVNKPLTWKMFIDDVFCLWDTNKEEIEHFVEQANSYHPTIKFTAEVSQLETTFLDTTVYKGERFEKESILYVHAHTLQTNWNISEHKLQQLPPMQQALRKDSLKEKRLGSWGQTLLRLCLRRTLKILEHAWHREVILITWWTKSSPKLNSQKERTLLHKHRKRTKEFYPLWHNFIHHCHSNGKMASNTKPATTKRYIQGSSLDLL